MSVLGTAARNLINLTGLYEWNGTGWTKLANAGATAGNDTISGLGGNDTIVAGNGNDTVHGNAGDDRLSGGNGNDNLFGDAGNDWFNGGLGADAFVGGAGNDNFAFKSLKESAADSVGRYIGGGGDVIRDFTSTVESAQHDQIDLHEIAASIHHSLKWSGTTAKAYGVWAADYNSHTYVSVDGTGDGTADLVVKLGGLEHLGKSDFFLS
jgi:Ca2+-binding RTX toxin-like protein